MPCGWRDTLMASLASMGLSHAIARGILHGLTREKTSFVVTAKSRRLGGSNFAAFAPVREELLMALALILCIAGMALSFGTRYIEETCG
ncbi:Benzoate transporter OS=Rhodanobacter lindaniclasticus OX=75310 GN=B1991_02755 PE=4 SV=1 [Rhodanobacter lindaniclasticus]